MPRIVHFEISANDPEKVIAFYQNVFDWQITKWNGPEEYWSVKTGPSDSPGIDGGIFKPKATDPNFSATVNTVQVDNLDEYIKKVIENKGQMVTEKITIPGLGYIAYFKDIEGTIMGLHQADPNAGK